MALWTIVGWLAAGVILASFAEYWSHRLMHASLILTKRHRNHHRWNEGQGVLGELLDYLRGGTPVALAISGAIGVWRGAGAGVALFAGALAYAVVGAWAHQLSHENPSRIFWMPMPIHTAHHRASDWHHNFGVTVDWWDRVFGTYRIVDWRRPEDDASAGKGLFGIHWGTTPKGRNLSDRQPARA